MRTFKHTEHGFTEPSKFNGFPDDMDNRHRREMQELLDAGKAELLAADPPPAPPTKDERVGSFLQNPVLKAALLVLAAGQGMTAAQFKTAVKAKL